MKFRFVLLGPDDDAEGAVPLSESTDTEPPRGSRRVKYKGSNTGMVRIEYLGNGRSKIVALANFSARIVSDISVEDAGEEHREFELQAELAGRVLSFTLSAAEFSRMGWVLSKLGPQAIIYPGQRQHARAAIQSLSGPIRQERIFAHLGWRKDGANWVYLHGGGALGADGQVSDLQVRLPTALESYHLAPSSKAGQVNTVRASIRCLSLAPDRISVPLLASVYRAPFGKVDFSIFLTGKTGVFKSSLAAVCQQHFGASMDGSHLPANFASTAAAVQWFAYQAKDALLVVDDFAPTGKNTDNQLQNLSECLFRSAGNQQGRNRMTGNGQLSAAMPPRALVLATGEEVPSGLSIRARQLIVELKPGDVNQNMLSECQRAAREGELAAAIGAFLSWIASRYEELQEALPVRVRELRSQYCDGASHARLPSALAELQFGWETFLRFALEIKAIDGVEQERLVQRGLQAFRDLAILQMKFQQSADPALRFVTLLQATLNGGQAHLANRKGAAPDDPSRWGWQRGSSRRSWKPQGTRIGWVSGCDLFLDPVSSYQVAQQMAGIRGLAVSAQSLRHTMHESGLLVSTDRCRQMLTVRRTLENRPRQVLHLKAADFGQPARKRGSF